MRQSLLKQGLSILAFASIFAWSKMYGLTTWYDNLNINTNVINDNLDIRGVNRITGRVYVEATTTDVLITVTQNDSIVTSSLQLHLFAAAGHTITMSLTHDLLFSGSQSDFLITYSGQGLLQAYIEGGHALRFTSLPGSEGTQFYIIETSSTPTRVKFGRFPFNSFPLSEANLNAYVQVGPDSAFSFVAPTAVSTGLATEVGLVTFDPTNNPFATGRFVLQIENNASFVIDGHLITNLINPSLSDINVTVAAGFKSSMDVINSGTQFGDWSGLMVVNNNEVLTQLKIDPFCEDNFTQIRHGFVLGAGGVFETTNLTYLDYVVTVTNVSPSPIITATVLNYPCTRFVEDIVKDRNPAAFIVDGDLEAFAGHARIQMDGNSALYFRSGVDCNGDSTITSATSLASQNLLFTVTANEDLKDQGSIVFDVEGLVDIVGDVGGQTALNILSLQVNPFGGSVYIEGNDVVFPLRTFAKDANGAYVQYGSAAFMFNNRANFINTALQHTDQNHAVYENNIVAQSSPTYIGGESRTLGCSSNSKQNVMVFYNSLFLVHTDVATTGVDFLVANTGTPNLSTFVFYSNGYCIDNGTGRNLVLGTDVGALAENLANIINRDSHLDVMQDSAGPAVAQILTLTVAPNNAKINPNITSNITGQRSLNTIFLANGSNISIGTNGTVGTDINGNTFALTTFPTLQISGDYFSFASQGGSINQPQLSMTTGQGGIFVDTNGVILASPNVRIAFGAMVTKSRNGSVILPKNQIAYGPNIGLAQWQLNLTDPSQIEIVSSGQDLTAYTLDWKNLTKDYCVTAPFANIPYELPNVPPAGAAPAVTNANLTGLPIIRGVVDQLQIKNSRLGDQAQLILDGSQGGGLVRELLFVPGTASAITPTGFIVLQNNAILGLGTAARNVSSLSASVQLGINGVTLVANGNGTVRLNDNVIIDNLAHILTGTNFGVTEPQQLEITSVVPVELRVKSDGGILDLTQFSNPNQTLLFSGQVTLVLEPGAKVLLGGGNLTFAGQSSLFFEPYTNQDIPVGILPSATDDFRAKFIGVGLVNVIEKANVFVPLGAYAGVETDPVTGIRTTSQMWQFADSGSMYIGTADGFGGSFQVGNTTSFEGHIVTFSLQIVGVGSVVEINSQGLLGLAAGVVDKGSDIPSNWRVGQLFNVNSINLNVPEGTLTHQQIYPSSSLNASLLAIGQTTYNFSLDQINGLILGGGNLAVIPATPAFVNPFVLGTNGLQVNGVLAGILASSSTLLDISLNTTGGNPTLVNRTATQLYERISMNPYESQNAKTAAIFKSSLGQETAAYINGTTINRPVVTQVRSGTVRGAVDRALAIGAVGLALDNSNPPAPAYSLLNP